MCRGAAGTVLTGLFATGETTEAGLFYGGGALSGNPGIRRVCCSVCCGGYHHCILAIKHTIGLRVKPEEELAGFDVSEHGLSHMPDFLCCRTPLRRMWTPIRSLPWEMPAEAVPVKTVPAFEEGTPKFTKVEINARNQSLRH
ncbi:MAG: hypothetical protein ACLS8T_41700 [Anaerobutyricum sp.]